MTPKNLVPAETLCGKPGGFSNTNRILLYFEEIFVRAWPMAIAKLWEFLVDGLLNKL